MCVCVDRERLILTAEERGWEGQGFVEDHRVQSWQTQWHRCAQHAVTRANLKGRSGGNQWKPAGGILANAQRGTLSLPHPAWNLLFSRILPDLHPPLSLPLSTSLHTQFISKHLMSPHQENRPAQPAHFPPPPGSRGGWRRRRHFTRTDDAAKTTIMIINLLNLEDYAVN